MLSMMMMNFYQNPQAAQMMMTQMAGQGGSFNVGANQKNNLFVRKAKGAAGDSTGAKGKGSQPFYKDKSSKDPVKALDKKSPVDRPTKKIEIEEPPRERLGSDNFPPLIGNKKQIVTDPKRKSSSSF